MSDWDNDSDEAPEPIVAPIPSRKKWEDEDKEEKVQGDWDASSDEEEPAKEAAAPPPKKKVPLAQKIAERKAEEERKREAAAKRRQELGDSNDEDEIMRKERLHQLEVDADLENTSALFADVNLMDNSQSIEAMEPKTRAEFDQFREKLTEAILKHQKSREYTNFVDALVRDISVPLRDVDVRKVSSTLSALANEKQRAAREALKPKKKGASKPSLAGGASKSSAREETASFSRLDDDYDDFM
ncbi:hypothetical protein BZG36_00120 [Bifiguratus adelaidae]|uniref:Eukaryotic translation initiation factor 3 subunit J n=1 Tax=Bifiguratus adelaidae TaxID=1938954 RepID=A0A261Y873_9FUNG|nr:hypothetical protein BZG36_00120 [Bifiguratus adelaidae]